jgi:hypothetical protein
LRSLPGGDQRERKQNACAQCLKYFANPSTREMASIATVISMTPCVRRDELIESVDAMIASTRTIRPTLAQKIEKAPEAYR